MSETPDTRFTPAQRLFYLDEIKNYLPAFLSSAATERSDPAGDVTELLNLRPQDLQRLTAVHLGLSAPVTSLASGLRRGLRRPVTASVRPRVTTQAVRGSIDWGATIRHRAGGGLQSAYVVRPARRVFDTPENRALAWLLMRLDEELNAVAGTPESVGWEQRVHDNLRAIRTARRHIWLRDVRPERPTPLTLKRLLLARTVLYKILIPDALRAFHRWIEAPTGEDLTELLAARYFEPKRDWKLFELVVALRVARAFVNASVGKRRARLLSGGGRGPYAIYALPNGAEIRLWYQAWPDGVGPSIHAAVRQRHSIMAGASRPDIVVERRKVQPRMIILELKASSDPSYLGQGISQLLGYIKEYPDVLNEAACAWLVAPASGAFAPATKADDELWVTTADDVASEITHELSA